MAVQTVTKSMEMYAKKFQGQNDCFFWGMPCYYKLGASLPASLAGAFFPEKKPVLIFMYAKP